MERTATPVSSRFTSLARAHFEAHSLSVAVAHLVLVRLMQRALLSLLVFLAAAQLSAARDRYVFRGRVIRLPSEHPVSGVPVILTYGGEKDPISSTREITRTISAADGTFVLTSTRSGERVRLIALSVRRDVDSKRLSPGSTTLQNPSPSRLNELYLLQWDMPAKGRLAQWPPKA